MPASTDTGIPIGQRALIGITGLSTSSAPVNGAFHTSQDVIGVTWPVAGVFYSFDTVWASHQPELDDFASVEGRVLHVCWFPSKVSATVLLTDIVAGLYDTHIDQIMAGMAAWPNRIVCRFAHEMNGNFFRWSVPYTGSFKGITTVDDYIAAWQYIVTKGRAQCPNVEWYFCANGGDVGGTPAEDYYPGGDYVDIIGFDAYNGYGAWDTAFETYQPMYDRVEALNPAVPIWVGETGCKEDPAIEGRKGEWFTDFFAETRMAKLEVINYFDAPGGHPWQFQTSTSSVEAAIAGFASIINEDAIEDGFGVLPPSPPSPETFTADPLPLQELPTTSPEDEWAAIFTDPDWHRRSHGNAAHYINQMAVDGGGGTLASRPKTTGFTPAIEAQATGTGVATIAIMRLLTVVFDAAKRAIGLRSGGNNQDHWGLRMDGRQDWGSGAAPPDTHLYRNTAGQLATAAVWLDETTIPSANPSAGVTVYAEGNALKVRVPSLGSMVISRRAWDSAYASTHIFNDNPKLASSTGVQVPTGVAHLCTMFLYATKTITNVHLEVLTAGSGLSDCFVGVYDITGVQMGVSADVSTQLQSTGVRTLPLVTPVSNVLPQKLIIGILVGAGTAPFVRVFPTPGNWDRTGINQLFVRAGGSSLTALPAPINIAGLSATAPTAYLAALS